MVDQAGALESRLGLALTGVGHILDAVLVVNEDGHAPGTRVLLGEAQATIVGVAWDRSGPPQRYIVSVDGTTCRAAYGPDELTVLPGQAPF